MENQVFLNMWEEMPSGPVAVFDFSAQRRLSTSSSVHWMVERFGRPEGGQAGRGTPWASEKQLAKNELRRLALDEGEEAVVDPFLRVRGMRSRFGMAHVCEWQN